MVCSFWSVYREAEASGVSDQALISAAVRQLLQNELIDTSYYVSGVAFGTIPITELNLGSSSDRRSEYEDLEAQKRQLHLMGPGKVGVLKRMGWKPKTNPTPGKKWWAIQSESV